MSQPGCQGPVRDLFGRLAVGFEARCSASVARGLLRARMGEGLAPVDATVDYPCLQVTIASTKRS